jgi:hypothetical protein
MDFLGFLGCERVVPDRLRVVENTVNAGYYCRRLERAGEFWRRLMIFGGKLEFKSYKEITNSSNDAVDNIRAKPHMAIMVLSFSTNFMILARRRKS